MATFAVKRKKLPAFRIGMLHKNARGK
jgi:hypothetical protein